MRLMKFAVVPAVLLGAVACGGGGGAAEPSPTENVQPLASWYGQAAGPLGELGDAYTHLGEAGPTLAGLHDSTAAADLRKAALRGLAIKAPAGHPELDLAYDQVMRDAQKVADDITDNRQDDLAADTDSAVDDLDSLKAVIASTE